MKAATAAVQRIRDFLSVAWPAAETAAAVPFRSVTWLACLEVVAGRCGGDPARVAELGEQEFLALVTAAAGAGARTGPSAGSPGTCWRCWTTRTRWAGRGAACSAGSPASWPTCAGARAQLEAVEAEMRAVLGGELGLSRLGDIPGLTLTGAAVILAEAGDPRRYETSKSLVKHAGLSPADTSSGAFEGTSRISRRGRPGLRTRGLARGHPAAAPQPGHGREVPGHGRAPPRTPPRRPPRRPGPGPRGPPRPAAPPGRPGRRPGSRAPPRCCAGSAT